MPVALSPQALSYLKAVHAYDAPAFVSLFEPEAVVDDAGRLIHGSAAIREWFERDVVAASVTLTPVAEVDDGGQAVLTALVDGTFDRTGLPNPLLITHRIQTGAGGKFARLTCRLLQERNPAA